MIKKIKQNDKKEQKTRVTHLTWLRYDENKSVADKMAFEIDSGWRNNTGNGGPFVFWLLRDIVYVPSLISLGTVWPS